MGIIDTSYDLADLCDALWNAIDARREALDYTESDGEAATLDHLLSALDDEAGNLRTAGVAASLEAAQSSLDEINKATTAAKKVLTKLKRTNDMITLTGSVLSLAAAAASGNIGGIATGVAAVVSEAVKV